MKKTILFSLLTLLTSLAFGESQVIPKFRGLHNSETSILINDDEAQAIQDVDITRSGMGIKKRDGYVAFKTIGTSTWGVRGGYYFRDTSGADNIIHANDHGAFYSRTGGNYTAFITTDAVGGYYDFTDSQGFLWRATSLNDQIAKYDGTTLTYYPSAPKGDQLEALPSRLVISGTSANPNRLNFSAEADFGTFTTGLLESDAYTEDIGLPGQDVNAIKVACGDNVVAWTRDTTSMYSGTNQFDGRIDLISNTIGTLQPNSVIQDYGITYWQGQDKHFYAYDCNTVSRLSEKLDVSGFAGGGETFQWSQSEKADWDAGTLTYVTSALTVGDVQLSTWTATDTTTADFSAGSVSNTSVISNKVYLSTNNTDHTNNSFESGSVSCTDGETATGWIGAGSVGIPCVGEDNTAPKSGSRHMTFANVSVFSDFHLIILDANDATLTSFSNEYSSLNTSYAQFSHSLSSYVGRFIKLQFSATTGSNTLTVTSKSAFLCSGETITYWVRKFGTEQIFFDLVEGGRSSITLGTFTSQAFDTAIATSGWLASGANWTAGGNSITMQTQSSPDGSNWDSAVAWTTGTAPASDWDRYIRYVATISTGNTTNGTAFPYIDDVSLAARSSSGTFTSVTKNIGSNATAFRNFSVNETLNSGTIGYWIRTNQTEASLSTTAYTALTKDSQITATIKPWIQVKATFTITAATQDPSLQSFTVAWDEGAIIRTFGTVDVDHRLMWSVAEGTQTVPNATYIYDPRFDSWLRYAVPFDAPARVGSSIYFGNPSSGNVYTWPSGTSDNGSAITAYWQSKDFVGADPFVEKDYEKYSFLGKENIGSNIDITFDIDESSETTVNYTLTDPLSVPIRRINDYMPSGKFGSFISFKFGNNDIDAPFEVYGFKYDYTLRPWRVMQ